MKTMAIIPSRYEPERLAALTDIVWREVSECVVLDNGHDRLDLPDRVRVVPSQGMGIYAMWNRGWASARHEHCEAIIVLNDDIRILPGTLGMLVDALSAEPYVGVTYPDKRAKLSRGLPQGIQLDIVRRPEPERTLTGFAFAAWTPLFKHPPFDEEFHWWCGDDAFDRKVRARGFGVARVNGLPVEHDSDSESNDWARRPELRKLAEQDLARWRALNA